MAYRHPIPPAPPGVSPAIAAIWTEYFQAFAWGERDGASDDDTNQAVEEMDIAATRLAIAPCQSLRDIAAKAEFALYVQNAHGSLAEADSAVRTAALAALVAVVAGEHRPIGQAIAPRGVNQPPHAVHG